jgi:hypothetical protein
VPPASVVCAARTEPDRQYAGLAVRPTTARSVERPRTDFEHKDQIMSTRDEGARRGAATPTAAPTGDFPDAAAPYTPPGHTTQASAASTGPVIEQHTDRSSDERPSIERVAMERTEDRRDRVRWGPI